MRQKVRRGLVSDSFPVKGKTICLDVVFENRLKKLSSVDFWSEHLRKVTEELGMTYVKSTYEKFRGKKGGEGGVSVVCIILESHLAVHTWPEHNYVHIVLDSCKWDVDVKVFVKEILKPFSRVKFVCRVREAEWL